MSFSKLLWTVAACIPGLTATAQQSADTVPLIKRPADFGLIYPLSTNGTAAARYSNAVSIQGLAGVSGEITSAAVAGIANVIMRRAGGSEVAGIANVIHGPAAGVQVAGIANIVKGGVQGAEIAGLVNTASGLSGVQIAGLANTARKTASGLQIAGLVNRAGDTRGQLAGLLNKAETVRGVQISGMINIADSSDYPIGFINLVKTGEKSLGVSTDEMGNALLWFRSGGRVLYGLIGLGYNPRPGRHYYSLETGLGAHLVRFSPTFRLNAEAASLTMTDFRHGHAYRYSLTVLPELKIGRLDLFAGPSANLLLDYAHGRIVSLNHHYPWTTTGRNGHFIGAAAGFTGGVGIVL